MKYRMLILVTAALIWILWRPADGHDLVLSKYRGPEFFPYEGTIPSAAGLNWELWLAEPGPEFRCGGLACGVIGGGSKLQTKIYDWSSATAVYGPVDNGGLRVTISRLTPAALVRGGPSIDLFTGTRSLPQVHYLSRVQPIPTAAIPRFFALADGRVRPISELAAGLNAGLEQGWILFWWGEANPWIEILGKLGQEETRRLDLPVLVVFSDAATRIEGTGPLAKLAAGPADPAAGFGVRFQFNKDEGRLAVLPLYGKPVYIGGKDLPIVDPQAPSTTDWKEKLPPAIVDRCRFWAEHLAEVPTTVVQESVEHNPNADAVTIRSKFSFERLRSGGTRLAPLPVTLEPARRAGLKIDTPGTFVVAPLATAFGPYTGIEGTDTSTYTVAGLGKYLFSPRTYGNRPVPKTVQDKLNQEADRLVEAGILAPPIYFFHNGVNDPEQYHTSRERFTLSNPGQNLYALAQLADAVDPQRREKLVELMKQWQTKYPPETVAHQPWGDARRERNPELQAVEIMKRWPRADDNFHTANKMVPIESVYYLAAYCAATGDKPYPSAFDMSAPYLANVDWATGGQFRWGSRMKIDPNWKSHKDRFYGRNYLLELNQFMAGMIGQVRIARLAGNAAAEAEAWHAVARVAMVRLVAAKRGLVGSCDERGIFGPISGGNYAASGLVTYYDITPEVARFLGDYARPEVKQFCDEVQHSVPDWYRTWVDDFWIGEQTFAYPTDADQMFLCHVFALQDTDPVTLFRWCDFPWVPVGDMYYIRKLVETKRAYQGWEWK